MNKFKTFHYLIEIVVRLRQATKDFERIDGNLTKKIKTYWENKADMWIKENYKKGGEKDEQQA